MAALALMASCRFAPVFAPAGTAGLREPDEDAFDVVVVVIACREGSFCSCARLVMPMERVAAGRASETKGGRFRWQAGR